MAKTVVGLFDSYEHAHNAADQLERAGFARNDIGLVANESVRESMKEKKGLDLLGTHDRTAEGAGVGAALGGVAGLLIGLAAFLVPGIGPILAIGPIATTMAGFGIGAAAGGLIGALTRAGVHPDAAHYYAEGVRRGGTLVMVSTEDEEATRASDVLTVSGAVNVESRAKQWHAEGFEERPAAFGGTYGSSWPTSRAGHKPATMYPPTMQAHPGDPAIPALDNRPQDQRPAAETGAVTAVQTAPLHRVAPVSTEPFASVEPTTKTVAVNAMKEPPRIAPRRRPARNAGVPVAAAGSAWDSPPTPELAHAPVTATGNAWDATTLRDVTSVRPFDAYEDEFRRHCDARAVESGVGYEQARPAYEFGYRTGSDRRYASRDWDAVEPQLRADWEREHRSPWDRARDAARHAWDRVRSRI